MNLHQAVSLCRKSCCESAWVGFYQNPKCLLQIGDEILPNYIGIIISHCKDPFDQPPAQDASHHQDDMTFLVGNPNLNLHLSLAILGGG